MDYLKIQEHMNALSLIATAKGLARPRFKFEIESNKEEYCVNCEYYNEQGNSVYSFPRGETPEEAIEKARVWVNKIPDQDTRRRAEYRQAIAEAIDLGRKYNIEDAAINPLREVMEKLSKNALEHHPIGQSPVIPRDDFGDDIPFWDPSYTR